MMSFEEAEGKLKPYIGGMLQCVLRALREYDIEHPKLRSKSCRRSDSNVRWDFIWDELEREFGNDPNIELTPGAGSKRMVIGGEFSIRVKKAGRRNRPMNIITQRVLHFLNHEPEQPTLPGFSKPTSLDLMYRLSGAAEETASVLLRCPNGQWAQAWDWPIGTSADLVEVVQQVVPGSMPISTERVRPKVEAEDEEKRDEETEGGNGLST